MNHGSVKFNLQVSGVDEVEATLAVVERAFAHGVQRGTDVMRWRIVAYVPVWQRLPVRNPAPLGRSKQVAETVHTILSKYIFDELKINYVVYNDSKCYNSFCLIITDK